MGILKSTWKLLTEDPSKDISKASKKEVLTMDDVKKDYPNAWSSWSKEDDQRLSKLFKEKKSTKELSEIFKRTEGAIESRIEKLNLQKETEKKEPTLLEKLYTLKHSTYNHSDVSIKDIESGYGNYNYYSGYGYHGYGDRRYVSYDNSEYPYLVRLQISGRTLFNRVVPDFPGLTERQIMGKEGRPDFTSGILNFNEYNIKVQKITLILKVGEDRIFSDVDRNLTFYKSEIVGISVIRETLDGQRELSKRDISTSAYRTSDTNLNSVIFGYNDVIKNLIVSDFEKELDLHKKISEVSKILKSFNDNINEDVLSDLFAYSFDEVGQDNCAITKESKNNYTNWAIGINDVWEIKIPISDFRKNDLFSLNGNLSSLFIEVGNAVERLKSIYGNCNVDIDVNSLKNNMLIINVEPIYPKWLRKVKSQQSKGRNIRDNGNLYWV